MFDLGIEEKLRAGLDRAAQNYLGDSYLARVDFSAPAGEPALVGPDSVSWRIFKNPVSLFVGGVTAVLLEFAEPRVRTGVWEHSTFRTDPVARLKRTGLAAMVTVYGARSVAEKMIEGVTRMHARVSGETPAGQAYTALEPELLNWVQATAGFGFLEAYSAYVSPLTDDERNQFYREGGAAAALYGASGAPGSLAELQTLFADMQPKFEPSDIVFEFRNIMRKAPALPQPAQLAQRSLVRAAIDLVPWNVRDVLGLDRSYGLRPFEGSLVRRMGARADRLWLRSSPPVKACERLGLPPDYLFHPNTN